MYERQYKPFHNQYLDTSVARPAICRAADLKSRKNDFYSYCQGLRIIGRKKTRIDRVLVDMEEDENYYVTKIIVLQSDTE